MIHLTVVPVGNQCLNNGIKAMPAPLTTNMLSKGSTFDRHQIDFFKFFILLVSKKI